MLSLPTPPKCFAASVLATLHAAFARKVRARPSGCSTLEAIWVHLRYGPVARSPSFLDGFVNRLQDFQFPSFLLFKLRGFELLPRWDFHPLFMPAFAGRTLIVPDPRGHFSTSTIRQLAWVKAAQLIAVFGRGAQHFGNTVCGTHKLAAQMCDPDADSRISGIESRTN